MAISFSCTCGAEYEVPDHMAGQQCQCPACGVMLVVGGRPINPPPAIDDEEDDPATTYRIAGDGSSAVDSEPEVVDESATGDSDDDIEFVDDDEIIDDEQDPDAEPEYFVAVYASKATLRHPKTFRIYRSGRELLVVNAGPFAWGLVSTLTDRPGVREEFAHRRDSGRGGGVLGSDADEIARRKLAQRAAVLDRMGLAELRAEAESDQLSFRITAENTPQARIEPPKPGMFEDRRASDAVVGRLSFTHATTGKWELVLLSQADTRMAMGTFRRVLGHDNVHVTLRLRQDRA
jgi:hypothetical protein